MAFNLEAPALCGQEPIPDSLPKTVREALERQNNYQPRGVTSRLYKLLGTKGDDELRDAGQKLNFSFAPPDYDHSQQKIKMGSSGSNSVLYRRIVARTESMVPSSADQEAAELADWAVENILLPRGVKDELCEHAQTLRDRSSGSQA